MKQIVLYAYGMKSLDVPRCLRGYRMPINPIAPCRWDLGIAAVFEGDKIPLFALEEKTSGKVYPMLKKENGSVELVVREGTISVYQHLIHLLKALSAVKIEMPQKLISVRKKLTALKKLLQDIRKSANVSIMNEFRIEFRVRGNITYKEAKKLARKYFRTCELPYGVILKEEVSVKDYFQVISDTFDEIEAKDIFRGRNTDHLTAIQKHYLAQLFNSFGFSQGRWLRHLQKPVYPQRIVISGDVHSSQPTISTDSVEEIMEEVRMRSHPKKPNFVCASLCSGGCSKSFPDKKSLAEWIARNYSKDWRGRFLLTEKRKSEVPKGKQKSFITSAVKSQITDLSVQYDHHAKCIGSDKYVLFDVPADHQCLFHSLEGVLKPLYSASRCPDYTEIRAAVISFYQVCSEQLRQFFEDKWPGVVTMQERAQVLQDNPNEWGEHMDIQAAANFYNVDINVAIETGRRTPYIEHVYSYNQAARRSSNARKATRIIYFDGHAHFMVGHRLI